MVKFLQFANKSSIVTLLRYLKGRELCDQAMKIALETGNLPMLSQLFNDFADLDWWLFVQYEARGKHIQATE